MASCHLKYEGAEQNEEEGLMQLPGMLCSYHDHAKVAVATKDAKRSYATTSMVLLVS